MAAQPPCQPASTEAPWRAPFLQHITAMKSPTFVLSTLHAPAATSPPTATAAPQPRARTCVYRGLWAEPLPADSRNPAPQNPAVFDSDLPVFTTDARMPKAGELLAGPVEAVWWAAEAGTQWRVRGAAWALGPDVDGEAGRPAREAILSRMRRRRRRRGTADEGGDVVGEGPEEDWSWSREVTAHFGNLSPVMRGSFRNPPPGTPVAVVPPPGEGLGLGQEVDDLEDPVARANFRVVVIVPTEVDQVELLDPKRARRWLYIYRGASGQAKEPGGELIGEWEKVEVWP